MANATHRSNRRLAVFTVLVGLLAIAALTACGPNVAAPASCEGIRFSAVAPQTLKAGAPEATTIYDTITLDQSIVALPLPGVIDTAPVTTRVVTGHASKVPIYFRVFSKTLPPSTIPLALFVKGATPGGDTLVVTTRITAPRCPNGAQQRVPLAVVEDLL